MTSAGLKTVIENQQGDLIPKFIQKFLSFLCPICNKINEVGMKCGDTIDALAAIGKNPIIQLICEQCGSDINFLNNQLIVGKLNLENVYYILGWID